MISYLRRMTRTFARRSSGSRTPALMPLLGLGGAQRIDEAFQILEFVEKGTAVGSPQLSAEMIYGLLNGMSAAVGSPQATEERFKNKGAYIVLEPPNFDAPIFHSFEAVTPRPKVNP